MDWITTVFAHPYMESVLHGLERELTRYTGFSITMYVIIVLVLTPMFRSRKIRKKSSGVICQAPGHSDLSFLHLRE